MTTNIGFVSKIFVKESPPSSAKKWTAYSFKLQDKDTGEELPKFYQYGFDKPNFEEGSYIKFESTAKDDKADKVEKGSVKVHPNPPERPKAPEKKKPAGGGYKKQEPTKSELFGLIGGYNTEDDIKRMCWTNNLERAIQTVDVLLKHDGLPMTTAKAKANQAKRYEEIIAAIDKLTVKYFHDQRTQRILDCVADEGEVSTKAQGELPEDAKESEESNDDAFPSDDIPFCEGEEPSDNDGFGDDIDF